MRPILVIGAIAVNVLVLGLVARAFLGDGPQEHRAGLNAASGTVAAPAAIRFSASNEKAPSRQGGAERGSPAVSYAEPMAEPGVVIATVAGTAGTPNGTAAPPSEHSEGARKIRYMTASDDPLPGSESTLAELNARAEQVTYEANHRLDLLKAMYKLTATQQALIYPVLARASPAYDSALAIEGEAVTDAYLSAIRPAGASSAGASASSASRGVAANSAGVADATASRAAVVAGYVSRRPDATASVAPSRAIGDRDAAVVAGPVADTADADTGGSAAVIASTAPDAYDAALASSLATVEADISPFLDNEQLATMSDEQVDRYYWWAEILGNLSGDGADETASGATDASTSPADSTPAATDGGTEPTEYQGGNLLDLLNP